MIMKTRYILPSAIRCFFHVYAEHLGTYGFSVKKHVLVSPWKTACGRDVGLDEYVTVGNDAIIDRRWCRVCAAAVDAKMRHDHGPTESRTSSSLEIA